MTLSQAGLQDALSSAPTGTFLECLAFTHSALEPLRLVNDTQDRTRGGATYHRFPFAVVAPAQTGDRPPQIRITADLVDQRLMIALRSIAGRRERVTIVYDVVRAETPETREYGPVSFRYESLTTDGATTVTIDASFLRAALDDAFPALQFAPSNAGVIDAVARAGV